MYPAICNTPFQIQKKPGTPVRRPRGSGASSAGHGVLEGLTGLEHGGFGGGDLDGFFRFGIAAGAGGPGLDLEGPETYQLDVPALEELWRRAKLQEQEL